MEVSWLPKGSQDLGLIVICKNPKTSSTAKHQIDPFNKRYQYSNDLINTYITKVKKVKVTLVRWGSSKKLSCQAFWESEPKRRHHFVHSSAHPLTLPLTHLHTQLTPIIPLRKVLHEPRGSPVPPRTHGNVKKPTAVERGRWWWGRSATVPPDRGGCGC